MSGTERHAVVIDLDRAERQRNRARMILLVAVATGVIVAALLANAANAPGPGAPSPTPGSFVVPPARTLALPAGVIDVDLSAFPDWLANEAPPASMRAVVSVRGIGGLASAEGPATINWTESGISYHMVSARRSIADLVALADALR